MRKMMAGLSLGVALGMAAPLWADYPGPSTYEKDPALSSTHRMTTAEQRIFERATIECPRAAGPHRKPAPQRNLGPASGAFMSGSGPESARKPSGPARGTTTAGTPTAARERRLLED